MQLSGNPGAFLSGALFSVFSIDREKVKICALASL